MIDHIQMSEKTEGNSLRKRSTSQFISPSRTRSLLANNISLPSKILLATITVSETKMTRITNYQFNNCKIILNSALNPNETVIK